MVIQASVSKILVISIGAMADSTEADSSSLLSTIEYQWLEGGSYSRRSD